METESRLLSTTSLRAPNKLAALIAVAGEAGIDPRAVIEGTGIEGAGGGRTPATGSPIQFRIACRNVLRAGAPANTAFELGLRLPISAYGMYGYALLTCATFREVTTLAGRLHRYLTPTLNVTFHESGGEAFRRFEHVASLSADDALSRFLVELQLSLHVNAGRALCGPAFRLLRVTCRHDEAENAELYRRYLDCPVLFGQPADEIHYPPELLDRPVAHQTEQASTMATDICERLLDRSGCRTDTATRVFRLVLRIPGRFEDMAAVASRLAMSERTLRRRLEGEETSFGAVQARAKCELAKEYLSQTRMSTAQIAKALGFTDASNFRHAFRRWTGRTTRAFRDPAMTLS